MPGTSSSDQDRTCSSVFAWHTSGLASVLPKPPALKGKGEKGREGLSSCLQGSMKGVVWPHCLAQAECLACLTGLEMGGEVRPCAECSVHSWSACEDPSDWQPAGSYSLTCHRHPVWRSVRIEPFCLPGLSETVGGGSLLSMNTASEAPATQPAGRGASGLQS